MTNASLSLLITTWPACTCDWEIWSLCCDYQELLFSWTKIGHQWWKEFERVEFHTCWFVSLVESGNEKFKFFPPFLSLPFALTLSSKCHFCRNFARSLTLFVEDWKGRFESKAMHLSTYHNEWPQDMLQGTILPQRPVCASIDSPGQRCRPEMSGLAESDGLTGWADK